MVNLTGASNVNNGLTLTFKYDPDMYPNCKGGDMWKDYSSGMIESYDDFRYGKFEASVKIPDGNYYWPAFWLFGGGGRD